MNVSEIMTRDVKVVSSDDTLQHAAQMMEKCDVGAIPVSENDRLVGMLTDRDIAIRAVARGLAPDTCMVKDIISSQVKYLYEDDSIEDAARSMGSLQIRRLPVVSRDKRLVGIVSLGDLAVTNPVPAGEALCSVSQD